MSSADLYALLKVPPTASTDEIRDALTREQRFWSRRASNAPNLADRQEAEQRVAQLSAARKTLLDGPARSQYDSTRAPVPGQGPAPQPRFAPQQAPSPGPFRISPQDTPAPQQAPYVPQTQSRAGATASFGQRFGAAFIDGIVATVIYGIVGVGGGSALGLIAATAYFVVFEGSGQGAALGKRAVGLRVVDAGSGGSIGYGRALVRQLGKYLSALAIGIGYLWMLWDQRGQTWHDKFANDLVVNVK